MDSKGWIKRCEELRAGVVKKGDKNTTRQYLLANFESTAQQKDIQVRTPLPGAFYRVKLNIKPWDEAEMKRVQGKLVDFSDNQQLWESMSNPGGFDMPYWAWHRLDRKKPLREYCRSFVIQLKACNLDCGWCYVDDVNKDGKQGNEARFFSAEEIVEAFIDTRQKQTVHSIRPSGGEPTLAIEEWLDILLQLNRRRLSGEVYLQGDTNLTTGHFLEHLQANGVLQKHILERIGDHRNIGVLCSFKGTDREGLLKAINKDESHGFLEEERWYSFERLVSAGIDAYPFVYDPNPETLKEFIDKGCKRFGDGFALKTWIFPLGLYGPAEIRLKSLGIESNKYLAERKERFARSEQVMQDIVSGRFGVNYKAIPRAGIELKIV